MQQRRHLVIVAAVIAAVLVMVAGVVVSRIVGEAMTNPFRKPSPTTTTDLGLPRPTQADVEVLQGQVAKVSHVTAVTITYNDPSMSRTGGAVVLVDVDLPEPVGSLSVDYMAVREEIFRLIWAQPFDVGGFVVSARTASGNQYQLGGGYTRDLYRDWGRPTASPQSSPTPS